MFFSRQPVFEIAAVLACGVLGCGGSAPDSGTQAQVTYAGEYPIYVVATTGPVAEMVTKVGGTHVRVEALMGPGVDPHLYRPVASDVKKLNDADVIFYNGLHLEGRMSDLFVQLARRKATFAEWIMTLPTGVLRVVRLI